MNNKKNKIIFAGIGLLVSFVFVFYLASFVIPKTLTNIAKASVTSKVSIKNSIIIGEKVVAEADGEDTCIVNVFVLDNIGKGISGKQVQLIGLDDQTGVSDNLGKATFKLTSQTAKQYELTATINGAALGKMMKVTFR